MTPQGGEAPAVWLVAGLGNPGPKYEATRHNVGYVVTDVLTARIGGKWRRHKAGPLYAVEGRLVSIPGMPGERVVLARGRCYMNESGGPVSALLRFYRAAPEQLVVVHDDLDLPYGAVRVKQGGGDGGHNGLKSIRKSLGTGDFYRVRVGIGRPPGRQDPADYVLRPFSVSERRDLGVHVERAADAVESLVTEGLEATQNRFHAPTP